MLFTCNTGILEKKYQIIQAEKNPKTAWKFQVGSTSKAYQRKNMINYFSYNEKIKFYDFKNVSRRSNSILKGSMNEGEK